MGMSEEEAALALEQQYHPEHPDYPFEDWQYEVSNGDTRLGYWLWVVHSIECDIECGEE